ncbi:pentapeptide repeat-containing protein [uncultured Jatrophihabitans sp.]|uniref:pentapeptide repeat-containing protein n=1 Tax=uncultured Jatrophihabitans sp. TaxID=1610747 RepID=UPI0035C9EB5A
MTAAELKRRWNDPEAMRLVRAVRSWLTGQAARPAGLGEVEGRVDLRGIPLTASPVMLGDKDDPSAGVVWESLDLSGAQVESLRFFGSRISDCRFDGASVLGLRLWGTEVSDCSFRRADLRSRALGTPEWRGLPTVWRRVAFDRAQLRESEFTGSVLEACTFEKTSKLLQLQDCEVIDCTFRGKLDTLLIDGRGLSQPVSPSAFSADFREAVFSDSSITGYVLDRVLLPEQADLVVVRRYPEAFRVAAARLSERAGTEVERRVVAFLEGWAQPPGAEESDCCFDLGPLEGAENAGFNEALERALGLRSLRGR